MKKLKQSLNEIRSDHLKSVFKNSNISLPQNQPKNLHPF